MRAVSQSRRGGLVGECRLQTPTASGPGFSCLSCGVASLFLRGVTMTFCEYTKAISEIYEELLALRAETESLRVMIEAITGRQLPRPRRTILPRLH
jgi:hypothetical protein